MDQKKFICEVFVKGKHFPKEGIQYSQPGKFRIDDLTSK